MEEQAPSRWMIILTAFIAIGICCAGLILTGPSWAHLVPDLPARAAQPPTFTPKPTLTPLPTKETLLKDDPQIQTYLNEVGTQIFLIQTSLEQLSIVLQEPTFTDQWITTVVSLADVIHESHDRLVNVPVPVQMRSFHTGLLNGTQDCDSSMSRMVSGLSSASSRQFETATELVISCGEKLGQSARELETILGEDISTPTVTLPPANIEATSAPLLPASVTARAVPLIPTPTPTPSFTITPTPSRTPTPWSISTIPAWPIVDPTYTPWVASTPKEGESKTNCSCSSNTYNCSDPQAKTCFSYCLSVGAGDIHDLDRDGDGRACE